MTTCQIWNGSGVGGITTRTQWNSCLQNFCEFLQNDTVNQHACRVVCLEFSSASGPPSAGALTLTVLRYCYVTKLKEGTISVAGFSSLTSFPNTPSSRYCQGLFLLSMPIIHPIESTLKSLSVGPSSYPRLDRAPVHCSHMRLLHIELVGMKSRKQLFLKFYVERVSRSDMEGCRQEYRDNRRNSRICFHIP